MSTGNGPAESDRRCFTCRTSSGPLAQVPDRKRSGNPRLERGSDAAVGSLTPFWGRGWEFSGIFQAGSWGHEEAKAPLVVSTMKPQRELKPRDSVVSSQGKRQHACLHVTMQPRGLTKLILTP